MFNVIGGPWDGKSYGTYVRASLGTFLAFLFAFYGILVNFVIKMYIIGDGAHVQTVDFLQSIDRCCWPCGVLIPNERRD